MDLADIEIAATELDISLKGCQIKDYEPALWLGARTRGLQLLTGSFFRSVERIGKALVFELVGADGGVFYVASRLGMSGRWKLYSPNRTVESAALRIRLLHPKGCPELVFTDPRKMSTLEINFYLHEMESLQMYGPKIPSAQFTEEWVSFFCRHALPLRSLLTEPRYMAGVGPELASEILFHAHLHPDALGNNLDKAQVKRLYISALFVIQSFITKRGTQIFSMQRSEKDEWNVHGREKKPCLICQTPIERSILNSKPAFWCPKCQAKDWEVPRPVEDTFVERVLKGNLGGRDGQGSASGARNRN